MLCHYVLCSTVPVVNYALIMRNNTLYSIIITMHYVIGNFYIVNYVPRNSAFSFVVSHKGGKIKQKLLQVVQKLLTCSKSVLPFFFLPGTSSAIAGKMETVGTTEVGTSSHFPPFLSFFLFFLSWISWGAREEEKEGRRKSSGSKGWRGGGAKVSF